MGGDRARRRAASKRFTYGLKGSTILAALLNALLLLVALGAIVLEAVQRIASPAPVDGPIVGVSPGLGHLGRAIGHHGRQEAGAGLAQQSDQVLGQVHA